jgi:hypothetical protein
MHSPIFAGASAFVVVWKYTVKPQFQKQFELEYGSSGSWFEFFSHSAQYLGSRLHKSTDQPLTYMLIDAWTDHASYLAYLEGNRERYDRLSESFESLYDTEEKLGSFQQL